LEIAPSLGKKFWSLEAKKSNLEIILLLYFSNLNSLTIFKLAICYSQTIKMFNHKNFQYSNNGIINFFWPIDRSALIEFKKKIVGETVIFLKNFPKDKGLSNAECLKIVNIYFILKVLSIYNEKVLSKAISKAPNDLDQSVFSDNRIDDNYLNLLKQGFRAQLSKKRRFKKVRNLLATEIRRDGFKRKQLNEVMLLNEIVCTGPSPLASEYLKKIKIKATLINIVDFFPGVNINGIQKALYESKSTYLNSEIYKNYIKIFENQFNEMGIPLTQEELKEFDNWHSDFYSLITYYQNILENNEFWPNQLWTSSSGIFWNKLLAREIRNRGGEVTVFDHAEGSNLDTDTMVPLVEFQEVDNFITHSATFVNYFNEISKYQVYSHSNPNLISIK
jgi:hypothetical protein